MTFASSEAFSAGVHLAPEALAIYSLTSPLFAYNLINVDKPLHTRLRGLRAPVTLPVLLK